MLFITDRNDVPSTAAWVHLGGAARAAEPVVLAKARFEAKRLTVKPEGLRIKRQPEE